MTKSEFIDLHKNIIGTKFNLLTVVGYSNKFHGRQRCFVCKCDCGNTKNVYATISELTYPLKGKHGIRSCGCLKHRKGKDNPNFKGYKEISGHLFSVWKQSAKSRNLKFNLTIKNIWDIYEKQNKKCALSGIDIVFGENASLDRINSNGEYEKNNVQLILKDVNLMKFSYSQEHFIDLCASVALNN